MHKVRVFVLNERTSQREKLIRKKIDHRALKGKMASGKGKKCYISLIFDDDCRRDPSPPFSPPTRNPHEFAECSVKNQNSPQTSKMAARLSTMYGATALNILQQTSGPHGSLKLSPK